MTACDIRAAQLVLLQFATQLYRDLVPLFTAKHCHGGIVAVALCKSCGEFVMLAVGNICLTWEVQRVVALNLEVFLIVEGRGPFRGYCMFRLLMYSSDASKYSARSSWAVSWDLSLGHLVYCAI